MRVVITLNELIGIAALVILIILIIKDKIKGALKKWKK